MSVAVDSCHEAAPDPRPLIVGLGGTLRESSSSERALRHALAAAAGQGARTKLFAGQALDLPMYTVDRSGRTPAAIALVDALAQADGVIIATPGYHGGISGLVKNALDYVEDLRDHAPPYLDGRAIGCIVCAYGWQATTTTLVSLRSTVHALRGWPTPLGVAINSAQTIFDDAGQVVDDQCARHLTALSSQVLDFAGARR
ncbi:NADPH-dependent FMN reductase [Saccharopolyspora mangrovi]|uniref:NAD(P)H-dependent oxidoreductase n=1 Tax=Saccharopolyspora mangrovi TaxID=3082379 RepID=A0ABU6AII3_9PSEU|nr:NAD(P)H-dependent oxidoreductase [Saccharopolyspora sp. S2-29]MEB3371374.1 NAD(P)H-dependent oxidoreductase [Saccharopolyspora sp. S2-29]